MSEKSEQAERFCRWFLRFNGYFSVENFIVHASDDPTRISNGFVAPVTETDLLAVRMPHSVEVKGPLHVANFSTLTADAGGKIDVIIGEVKTGNARPNTVWRSNGDQHAIEYLVRFVGLCSTDSEVRTTASHLKRHFKYDTPAARYRYIIFCERPNDHYANAGVQYVTFLDMFRFLVDVRGQCWINANIGVASIHYQWDPLINDLFRTINDPDIAREEKIQLMTHRILE